MAIRDTHHNPCSRKAVSMGLTNMEFRYHHNFSRQVLGWQCEPEYAAFAGFAFDAYLTTHSCYHAMDNR